MIIKQKGFLIAFLVFIGFVSIAYYVDTNSIKIAQQNGELSPSLSNSKNECPWYSSCSYMADGDSASSTSIGRPNESDAKSRAIATCNVKLQLEKDKRDRCLIGWKDSIKECESNTKCQVNNKKEDDTLGSCKLFESDLSSPCDETIRNVDGSIKKCYHWYNPPRTECSRPRPEIPEDRVGWSCTATPTGRYDYSFFCDPLKPAPVV